MKKKDNFYKKALKLLDDLNKAFPAYGLGRHIDAIQGEYGSLFNITDKEFCAAIEKYHEELSLDIQTLVTDDYVYQIQQDAEHLFDVKEEEEYDT